VERPSKEESWGSQGEQKKEERHQYQSIIAARNLRNMDCPTNKLTTPSQKASNIKKVGPERGYFSTEVNIVIRRRRYRDTRRRLELCRFGTELKSNSLLDKLTRFQNTLRNIGEPPTKRGGGKFREVSWETRRGESK